MIYIVIGTRPEIIKMSPIIQLCDRKHIAYKVVHTNQHYSYELDEIFFKDLDLPTPDYNLKVGSGSHGKQMAKIIEKTEKIFLSGKPDIVLVEGDTNTVFGAAFSASRLQIPVGHVEAGLRSGDMTMPEEVNRILTDHISSLLFAPTEISKNNLLREGISKNIYVVGNSIVDATYRNILIAEKKSKILEEFDFDKHNYILLTAHRAENVDNPQRLLNIVKSIELISQKLDTPMLYPIHPRTVKRLKEFGYYSRLMSISKLVITKPLGYLDFLVLEKNALVVITDSGGVQEESCILQVPCVTIRDNTERPETLNVGANMLAGTEPKKVLEAVQTSVNKKRDWTNPFGDGKTSKRILDIIISRD
ncbi:UDP-N-acetylglucosamine 2-epimerase (non-hydrolyzing) [Candidatus Micrarchaeota archaeon]|nr:MAG: UDP-N-acetylglucosamine 2-epimerase (non-hydrolyzing) [Candidatus Micrarchaeota archaeon]